MASLLKIRERALRKVGVYEVGQTIDAVDDASASEDLTSLLTKLRELSLAPWDISGAVPAEYEDSVVDLLAWKIAPDYGVGNDRAIQLKASHDEGMRYLERLKPAQIYTDVDFAGY